MKSSHTSASGVLRSQRYATLGLYYAAFLFFAIATQPESSRQIAALLAVKIPELALPILSAWLGTIVAIAIVFVYSREEENASDQTKNRRAIQLILAGIAVDLICNFTAKKWGVETSAFTASGVLRLALIATGNLGILSAATGAGLLVARGLKQPHYLIMAAVVGAVTDIFSVYAGPSKAVLASAAFPYLGFQWGVFGQGVIPCVGAGDFIFLCLYFAGARRFHLSERKTFIAMGAAFGLGFLSIVFSPAGIPALPFMATLLLLVHGRELNRQMKDLRAAG